jgi:hypothetical protein
MAQLRVQRSSVQGAVWLSSGCSMAQFRVLCGSVQGAAWFSTGCSMAQLEGAALLGCCVGQPLIIQLRPFPIFSKVSGDIHSSRCTTGVKWKKSSIRKVFIISFGQ